MIIDFNKDNHLHLIVGPNIHENILGASTVLPSRQIRQTLPVLFNEDTTDYRQEKRNSKEKKRLNEINKYPENSRKEPVGIKGTFSYIIHSSNRNTSLSFLVKNIRQPLKTNQMYDNSPDQIETFRTSTPRHLYEHDNQRQEITNHIYPNPTNKTSQHNQSNTTTLKKPNINNINRRHQSIDSMHDSKLTRLLIQSDFESKYSPRNTIASVQSRPTKLIRTPHIQYQTEQKAPVGSVNTLLQTTRLQPTNSYHMRREREINRLTNTSKMDSTQLGSNKLFPTRSPTSWSVISDHPLNQQQYSLNQSSSSSRNELTNDKSTHTYQMIVPDKQQPLDGRYVIPFAKYVSDVQKKILFRSFVF